MSETPLDAHNRIATATATQLVRELVESGGNDAALMIVLESVIVGVMRSAEIIFGVSRVVTAEYLEVITERALERLAALGEGS